MRAEKIKTIIYNECELLQTTLKNDDFVGFSLPIQTSNKDFIVSKIKEIQSACRVDYSIHKLKYLIDSFRSWGYLLQIKSRKKINVLCFDIVKLIEAM